MNKLKILIQAFIILILLATDGCISDGLNSPPEAVSLTTPLKAVKDVLLNDSLIWQEAIDPDGDLIKYDVYFGVETNPVTVVSTRQEETSYTPELHYGTTYYWKILAQDGAEGTSESDVWSFTTISPNNPPGEVILTLPDDAESDVTLNASLIWQATTDPDGDAVTYDVYFDTSPAPTTIVSNGQIETSYSPTLSEGTRYFWKIVAKDGKGGTSESEVWAFSTTISNSPPGAFTLISPENGAIDNLYIDFQLQWNASIDPDGDAVTYDVLLGTSANPSTVISSNQTGTAYVPTLANGTTYYWKVVAKDGKGGTRESAVWSFTTINYPPGEFSLTIPANAATNVAHDDTNLKWNASTDPDGDAITYDVYLSTNANPTTVVSSAQGGTSFTPTLAVASTYYWKVIAKDGNGGTRESAVWSFTTKAGNNPPDDFNLLSPPNKTENVTIGTALSWEAASDPDGNSVSYDVYIGTDADPRTVVSKGQLNTTFSPTLQKGNTYFWKVVAKDGIGGNKESAIWNFKMVPAL